MNRSDDLFEAFLKGRLSADERYAFETRLRDDAAFAQELAVLRTLHDLVNLAGEQRVKEKLDAIHREVDRGEALRERPAVIRMRPLAWLAIAASITLAIGAFWIFLGRSKDPHQLYAAHMSPYAAPDRTRSDEISITDHWRVFGGLYETARYDEALIELDSLPVGHVPDYLVSFYRGQCLLLRVDPDPRSALHAFEEVLRTDNDLHAVARWYMGLAALRTGEIEVARTQMKNLHEAGGYRSTEAARILEELGDP